MDTAIVAFLLFIGMAALSLTLRGARVGSSRLQSVGPRSRSWTSPLSAIQARTALATVGERLGYSVDPYSRPGLTVLSDSTSPASYGQIFSVSLASTGGSTLVKVGIAAKDPERPLTRVVQERRLEDFARSMRSVFAGADGDVEQPPGEG